MATTIKTYDLGENTQLEVYSFFRELDGAERFGYRVVDLDVGESIGICVINEDRAIIEAQGVLAWVRTLNGFYASMHEEVLRIMLNGVRRLAPCPWGTHHVTEVVEVHDGHYHVICRACEARGPARSTRDGAEEAWRERA